MTEQANMNIYRFINSKDIRKHLEDMKYEFNALEAAWLVSQCKDVTLEEKHNAWKWIIDNMPDMEVKERINCSYRESLHDTLNKYMELDKDLMKEFCAEDEGVYTCILYENGNKITSLTQEISVFFNHEDCIRYVKEFLDDYREYLDEAIPDQNEQKGYASRTVAKAVRHFKNHDHKIVVTYDINCRIKYVDIWKSDNEEHFELISQFFDGFWFDFPTPFKKGDIVYKVGDKIDETQAYDLWSGICVLTSLFPWGLNDEEKRKHYIEGRSGDNSDMTYYGYFQYEDGTFYHECNWTYMDLEFYRGPFNGVRRACKALSSFLKGDIDIGLFSLANRQFILEKQKEIIKEHCHFTDEGLKLAGLIDGDEERKRESI